MNPSDTVEIANGAHVFRQVFGQRPLKIVNNRNDFAVGFEGGDDFAVDPVLALVVTETAIQRVRCQHQQEILGLADRL